MKPRPISQLSDRALLQQCSRHIAKHRAKTAHLLATLGEFDARGLYLSAGCDSTYEYCVKVLHEDEDELPQRIRVARLARQFPAIFPAIANGRLHLEAVELLAPHLTPENADELLAAAEHKPESEIVKLLRERFA